MVDYAVVNQRLGPLNKGLVTCPGGAVGVKHDVILLRALAQHFRHDQGNRPAQAVPGDNQFLSAVKLVQVTGNG